MTHTDWDGQVLKVPVDEAGPLSTWSRLVRRWAPAPGAHRDRLYVVAPRLLALFGSFPRLRDVDAWWLVVLTASASASMWWLTRLALRGPALRTVAGATTIAVGTAATAHLAGNAAGKIVPGGPATAGVVQAKVLIDAGEPPAAVASAMTAMGLLLLLLPVLTVPALLIGPPPAARAGLLLSLLAEPWESYAWA